MAITLYHNPSCSKSRALERRLDGDGVRFEVVEYLRDPLSREDLAALIEALDVPPAELVRRDDRFRELGLDADHYTADTAADAVIDLLVSHPELMQRPILRVGDRAAIGRPAEHALALL